MKKVSTRGGYPRPAGPVNQPCCGQVPESRRGAGMSAVAEIRGGPAAPRIYGRVCFMDAPDGTWVCASVAGLPPYQPAQDGRPPVGPHGFHIHEYGDCTPGTLDQPFPATGEHWNPDLQPHGNHAGDFPVLFSNRGLARMCFFTDRFRTVDVIGRSVVIHENPDDYRTQPAGASGRKLACGVILAGYCQV